MTINGETVCDVVKLASGFVVADRFDYYVAPYDPPLLEELVYVTILVILAQAAVEATYKWLRELKRGSSTG